MEQTFNMDASLTAMNVPPAGSKAFRIVIRVIEAVSALLLVALIGLLLTSVFYRYVLGTPIIFSDELSSLLFLWVVMLGSVIAIDRGEHLRLAVVLNAVKPRVREFMEAVGMVAVGAFLIALLPPALEHVAFEADVASIGLGISMAYRVAGIPLGIMLMLLVLGKYATTIEAVARVDFEYLAPFIAGAILGAVALSRVLSALLAHHAQPLMLAATGIMGGSLLAVWPFQHREFIEIGGTRHLVATRAYLPETFDTGVLIGLAAMIAGAAAYRLLQRIAAPDGGTAGPRPAA